MILSTQHDATETAFGAVVVELDVRVVRKTCSPCNNECLTQHALRKRSEITPLWWTPQKELFSSEFHQCNKEGSDQSHSRETRFAA